MGDHSRSSHPTTVHGLHGSRGATGFTDESRMARYPGEVTRRRAQGESGDYSSPHVRNMKLTRVDVERVATMSKVPSPFMSATPTSLLA